MRVGTDVRTEMSHMRSLFFFSSIRRHTRYWRDWSSDVCSSDLRSEFPRVARRAPSQARSRAFYELADRFDWAVIGATRNEHLRRTIAELRPHTARLRKIGRASCRERV